MKIYNTVPYFLENYKPTPEFLQHYHEKYSFHFTEYFQYYIKNNLEKRIELSLLKYPAKMDDIRKSNEVVEQIISQIVTLYKRKYDVEFNMNIHIIIGLHGSNAFTHRQIIPDITFCLEKLSSKEHHLKVIIAHEFGHVLHIILSEQAGVNWANMQWEHPYTWLLQEGCATYFSKQIVDVNEEIYFLYEEDREGWLQFANNNKKEIIKAFQLDVKHLSSKEVYMEWFSINGGSRFGYSRLAYFFGYSILQFLIEKFGEKKAVTLWKKDEFPHEIEKALIELAN